MESSEQCNNVYNLMLKNFAGADGIYVADMSKNDVSARRPDMAFRDAAPCDEVAEFEKRFSEIIEKPMDRILSKINRMSKSILLTRTELETIKKYILLQMNRTPYSDAEAEDDKDLWKRETSAILDMEWDDLMKSDLVDVLKDSAEVNNSFLLFFRTDEEFVIGDSGCVAECVPGTPEEGSDEEPEDFINYNLFPLTSEIAVLLISLPWKMRFSSPGAVQGLPLTSPILEKYRSVPKMKYVNERRIRSEEDVSKFKHPQDRFTYMIHNVSKDDLHYLNTLTINESERFIGFMTPEKVKPTLESYESMKGSVELAHDLSGILGKL
ncbi:MAG: DUF4238 domain-containing protein [Candidatus Methanomethylophilaceae archaeon]|nr:DUF4238 domain-containing protein [Candidatus Methanomethylophilaceae archaeon]